MKMSLRCHDSALPEIIFFQLLSLILHRLENMRILEKGFTNHMIFLVCEYLRYVCR